MRFIVHKILVVLGVMLAVASSCPVLRAAGEAPSIPGFSLDEIDRRDNEILNLDLSPMSPGSPAAFEDVPPDHWAYKAVQYLAGIGFLEGYDGGQFRGDQVITRYELSVIVTRMLQNYNKFSRQGYIERNVPIDRDWPDAEEFPPPQISYMAEPVRKARTLPQTVRIKKITEPPLGPISPSPEAYPTYIQQSPIPSLQPSSRAYSSGEIRLQTGPGTPGHSRIYYQSPTLGAKQESLRQSGPKSFEIETKPATSTADAKSKDADKDKSKDKSKDKGKDAKIKVPKELKKVADKFEVTEKDIAIFEALVKYVKDEMKDQKAEIKKEISEVKRMAKKSEGDIDKLIQENQRYKITGGAKFQISSSQTEYGASNSDRTSVGDSAWHWSSIYSKPRKLDDLVFTYDGSVRINYQDFTTNREHPKNFKLRGLYTGVTGLAFSPLSIFGSDLTGFSTSMLLNKFEIQMGLGRKNANDYMYGAALKTSLFNNPQSFLWLTRFVSFQDRDNLNSNVNSNGVNGCYRTDGNWANEFYPVGSWTSSSALCMPPVKNSITSAFLQTPLPIKNWSIWFEYAHSTYYRPGFNMSRKNENSASTNYSNPFNPKDMYSSWAPILEKRDSDEAFLALLVYNKGPISIFPLGYVHLGNQFVSRYLGMPGMDMSTLSLDALPINIQSLDLFIARPTITKTDDKWKDEILFLTGGEHKPMYLDPSAMYSQPTLLGLNLFERLNNRGKDALLRATYYSNTFTYYVSDNIQLSAGFSLVRVAIGPGCVDGNVNEMKNDAGDTVIKSFGNGVANCNVDDPQYDSSDFTPNIRYRKRGQSYSMYWKTSKKASMNFSVSKNKDLVQVSLGSPAADTAIKSLIPSKQSQGFSASLNYRLTDVSTVSMWYNDGFISHLSEFYKSDGSLNTDKVSAMGSSVGFSLEMSF